jgi:hypothetical protein
MNDKINQVVRKREENPKPGRVDDDLTFETLLSTYSLIAGVTERLRPWMIVLTVDEEKALMTAAFRERRVALATTPHFLGAT